MTQIICMILPRISGKHAPKYTGRIMQILCVRSSDGSFGLFLKKCAVAKVTTDTTYLLFECEFELAKY